MGLEIEVDGQVVLVPTADEWDGILKTGEYKGVFIFQGGFKAVVSSLARFVLPRADLFCLGLYRMGKLKSLTPLLLFRFEGGWQRVQVETVSCNACHWEGNIANPSEPTLYFGVLDEALVYKKAISLPRSGCPKCGAVLPRIALWVES
ncbi:hypothetical protein NLK61_04000 [Pseudomonas fuscovaginae UPB0736]|uniref:hypothetical protein n=1 Tax=Pseudomonas asplenii TaxID=53407 RepID=UPI0012BB61F6|nr:hypothetical protein [Pseudomonas fuscovaginae]UUQ65822.1 hypothetical protein NLK61_04000 [Pseudomonas fuscovaginae UPB0736]